MYFCFYNMPSAAISASVLSAPELEAPELASPCTSPTMMTTGDDKHMNTSMRDGEGVEVILEGESAVVDDREPESIFRGAPVRPRAVRQYHGSDSWGGYGPPPQYPGSFDNHEQNGYHPTPQFSPHVQYPRYDDGGNVNVISPNHRTNDPQAYPTPTSSHYHYPPTSPVSRPGGSSAPRTSLRNYAIRRGGDYSRSAPPRDAPYPHDEYYPEHVRPTRPPVVQDSFDSEHRSRGRGHPHPHDAHSNFYGGGSWGSFDSAHGGTPQPPHFDDQRYYNSGPPESPYHNYNGGPYPPHHSESFPPGHHHQHYHAHGGPYGHPPPSFTYSYDGDDRYPHEYPPEPSESGFKAVTPNAQQRSKSTTPVVANTSSDAANRHMMLPLAASEVDFEVTDPPMDNVTPPSEASVCASLSDVNQYDVLCGRGGGTNSQIGNRKFRKLVQDFQPTYLLAKRKEKPLLARTIVLIIRKRGGRFLKKVEDTGELFEVGDAKAEAKTSQALREGLDVRATRSAGGLSKSSKKNCAAKKDVPKSPDSTVTAPTSRSTTTSPTPTRAESPPNLPPLQAGTVHPHSPDRSPHVVVKRRRMRSTDRYMPDFMPPRATELTHRPSLADEDDDDHIVQYPRRGNGAGCCGFIVDDEDHSSAPGCAGIAMDLMTGAATGSFCLGPTNWRRP